MSKFEVLPNEVLLLCFQFFDAVELFDSFDGLNRRFNQLIRQIPLSLNFEYVRKSIFDHFCTQLLTDKQLRKQIYSLKLSNEKTIDQIHIFLSKFSLDQFPHLRSLTLYRLNHTNSEVINLILPSLRELNRLSLYSTNSYLLENYRISKPNILTLELLRNFHETSTITHLSVTNCSHTQLIENFFQYLPLLKYLRIAIVSITTNEIRNTDYSKAIHLKHLIFDQITVMRFEQLVPIFRHTPNLTNLTILRGINKEPIVNDIEQTITTFLPLLKTFKFCFIWSHRINQKMAQIFPQFQTDFWHKQHQWFTQCFRTLDKIQVYTTPYPNERFQLTFFPERYLFNSINVFDHIRYLPIEINKIHNSWKEFYFPNVEILIVESSDGHVHILQKTHIELLKSIINFSRVKHFRLVENVRFANILDLIDLFQQMTNLVELTIVLRVLVQLLDQRHFCNYLRGKIRTLNLIPSEDDPQNLFDRTEKRRKFREVFSNIQQFTGRLCSIESLDQLIDNFTKISIMDLHIRSGDSIYNDIKQLERQNVIYAIEDPLERPDLYLANIQIWL